MLKKVQQAVIHLTAHAERAGRIRDLKRFVVSTAAMFRSPSQAISDVQGLLETAAKHEVETRSWVGPEALRNGSGGPFDACDLRHWLVLAERAGVPHVPAREILHLTEEEMSLLSGEIDLPDTPAVRRLRKGAESVVAELGINPQSMPEPTPIDRETLIDSLFDAMDTIPEGWMVRSNRCGGSELKSLAGFGIIGREVPEVRFGPNLEVGPGWVRLGNRRRVNVSDARTVKAAAEGPGFMVFLARPWQECSRYIAGDDPHRHGTPYAGKGVWPAGAMKQPLRQPPRHWKCVSELRLLSTKPSGRMLSPATWTSNSHGMPIGSPRSLVLPRRWQPTGVAKRCHAHLISSKPKRDQNSSKVVLQSLPSAVVIPAHLQAC